MDDSAWTEERVRRLLISAEPYTRPNAGTISGAQLGLLLRRLDPAFRPDVLGDPKLINLLARFPDVGAVERDPSNLHPHFRFLPLFGTHQRPDQVSAPTASDSQDLWIDREFWLGLVANHPGENRYIDLQTNRVLKVSAADNASVLEESPVDKEPERYLAVPPIPQDDLRSVARDFVGDIEDVEERERLHSMITGDHWFRNFTDAMSEQGRLQAWLTAHRHYVLQRARAWFSEHGLQPEHFVGGRRRFQAAWQQTRSEPPPRFRRETSAGRNNLRQRVLDAVRRMPEEELLDLKIRLKYLVSE
jgi:hypothetical protein